MLVPFRIALFSVKYVMKVDDDVFVNVPNLIHYLLGGTIPALNGTLQYYNKQTVHTHLEMNRFKFQENTVVGFLLCRPKPITDYENKW